MNIWKEVIKLYIHEYYSIQKSIKTIDDLYIPLTVSKRNIFDASCEEDVTDILINSYKR